MCDGHNPNSPHSLAATVRDSSVALPPSPKSLLNDLLVANRVLFKQGAVDAFGHASVRHGPYNDYFLLARNMVPGRVTADDVVTFDFEGIPINAKGRKVYLERFIHSDIYRSHPDIMAVVHSHPPSIVPLSVLKAFPLRPLFRMAGFIGRAAPVFEIRDVGGSATNLLISSRGLRKALAGMFSDSCIVLMRGHGSTVVANDLRTAVYRAVYAEINARYQFESGCHGKLTYLTVEEAEVCVSSIERQVQRPWDLWKEQAMA